MGRQRQDRHGHGDTQAFDSFGTEQGIELHMR
jgi:hypothetical protein